MDAQKLAAAKLWLISPAPPGHPMAANSPRDLPYLAHALYALIAVASTDVERMTVDEWWRVYVNPAWLDAAATAEVGRELAHVTWHLLADHTSRARDQGVDRGTATTWTSAADATVTHTLDPDHLRPDGLPSAADLGLPPGLSAEEYYAMLGRLPACPPAPPAATSTETVTGAEGRGRRPQTRPGAAAAAPTGSPAATSTARAPTLGR